MDYLVTSLDNKKKKHYKINRTGNHCFIGSNLPSDLEAKWSLHVFI